jgi:hypothetical protein
MIDCLMKGAEKMANISPYKGGFRVEFIAAVGRRTPIYLGDVTRSQANAFLVKLEALVAAQRMGHPPDNDVMRWIGKLDATL